MKIPTKKLLLSYLPDDIIGIVNKTLNAKELNYCVWNKKLNKPYEGQELIDRINNYIRRKL